MSNYGLQSPMTEDLTWDKVTSLVLFALEH